MSRDSRILLIVPALLLGGCVQTVASIVTIPVKVASAAVDAVTTSQSEKDEKLGRQLRKQDEERGRLVREQRERCLRNKALPSDDCSGYAPH